MMSAATDSTFSASCFRAVTLSSAVLFVGQRADAARNAYHKAYLKFSLTICVRRVDVNCHRPNSLILEELEISYALVAANPRDVKCR